MFKDTKIKKYKIRTFFVVVLAIWICLILFFAAQSQHTIDNATGFVSNFVIEKLDINLEEIDVIIFSDSLLGAAYFVVYAVLGMLIFASLVTFTSIRFSSRIFWPLLASILVAVADAAIVKIQPTRFFNDRYVYVACAGALVSILFCAFLIRIIHPLYECLVYSPRLDFFGNSNDVLDDEFIKNSGLKEDNINVLPSRFAPKDKLQVNLGCFDDANDKDIPQEDAQTIEESSTEETEICEEYISLEQVEETNVAEEPDSVEDAIVEVESQVEDLIEDIPDNVESCEETVPPVLETEPVVEQELLQEEPEIEESIIEESIIEEPVVEEVIAKPDRPIKSYPKRFPLSEELYYAASVIGKVNIEVAKRNEKFANTAAPTRKNMERLYLTLGKTEHTKMEIVDVLNSDISFEEKIELINKEQKDTYEYFDSIIPQ